MQTSGTLLDKYGNELYDIENLEYTIHREAAPLYTMGTRPSPHGFERSLPTMHGVFIIKDHQSIRLEGIYQIQWKYQDKLITLNNVDLVSKQAMVNGYIHHQFISHSPMIKGHTLPSTNEEAVFLLRKEL
jgi:hypothetical protein